MRYSLARSLFLLAACLLLILAAALVRPVLPSFAASVSIVLSPTSGPSASTVQVNGNGFKSGETVTLTFDTTRVGSVTASSTGSISTTVTVPSSALPGNHIVQASAAFLIGANKTMNQGLELKQACSIHRFS